MTHRFAERLERELRRGVGRDTRCREAATDRADVDDPAPPGPEERDRGLGERDGAEQVDVEHEAPVRLAHVLDRAADPDARIADERLQTSVADGRGDVSDDATRVVAVRDVEDHRTDVAAVARRQPLAVLVAAHACEDGPTVISEAGRARLADPGGGASDQSGPHGPASYAGPCGAPSGPRRQLLY